PATEAVVRVNHVKAVTAVRATQLARSRDEAGAARLEAEHLDLDALDAAQRFDLIGDEAAALGVLGARIEARDDEDPHARFVTAASGPVTPAGGPSQPPRHRPRRSPD